MARGGDTTTRSAPCTHRGIVPYGVWTVSESRAPARRTAAAMVSRAIRARPPETASTDPGAVRPVRCIPSTQSGYCRASRSATRPVPSGESSSTIRTWQPWGEHARDQHRQVVPFVEGRDDDEDHHAPYDLRRSGGFGFDGLQRSVPEQTATQRLPSGIRRARAR